jgi:DNA-binding NarL/FixJ family response regulator
LKRIVDVSARVALVGSDSLALSTLARALDGSPGITLASRAADAPREDDTADVVVWDLGLEPKAALDRLRRRAPEAAPVLALVPREESAQDALQAGARGILFRDADPRALWAGAMALVASLVVVDDDLRKTAIRGGAAQTLATPLTPREREVLQLVAEGLPNKLIADRLGISEHTAKFHVNAILDKLGADTRTDAVVKAARFGLLLL